MDKKKLEDNEQFDIGKSPSGARIAWNEIVRDKIALFSLIFLVIIIIFVYGISIILDKEEIVRVDLFSIYESLSKEFWLGTDYGGRDVFGQLIVGTRNSLSIGFIVTIFTGIIGIVLGLTSGYFGGHIDNLIMRIVDFLMILPFLMLVIVFVALVPKYSIISFSLIMTAFLWMGKARLIRSRTLAESQMDYVQASRTLGTPNVIIMFREVFPNIISLVIVNLTLSLA